MLTHDRRCLLTRSGARIGDGVDGSKNFIMAADVIIHRGDINSYQACDALWCQRAQRHHRFAAHRVTNKGGFLNLRFIESIKQILSHRGVGHLRRARGETVVSHVDLHRIVIDNQIAGEDPKVVQAAKKAVDQDDRGIIVLILCRLRSAI